MCRMPLRHRAALIVLCLAATPPAAAAKPTVIAIPTKVSEGRFWPSALSYTGNGALVVVGGVRRRRTDAFRPRLYYRPAGGRRFRAPEKALGFGVGELYLAAAGGRTVLVATRPGPNGEVHIRMLSAAGRLRADRVVVKAPAGRSVDLEGVVVAGSRLAINYAFSGSNDPARPTGGVKVLEPDGSVRDLPNATDGGPLDAWAGRPDGVLLLGGRHITDAKSLDGHWDLATQAGPGAPLTSEHSAQDATVPWAALPVRAFGADGLLYTVSARSDGITQFTADGRPTGVTFPAPSDSRILPYTAKLLVDRGGLRLFYMDGRWDFWTARLTADGLVNAQKVVDVEPPAAGGWSRPAWEPAAGGDAEGDPTGQALHVAVVKNPAGPGSVPSVDVLVRCPDASTCTTSAVTVTADRAHRPLPMAGLTARHGRVATLHTRAAYKKGRLVWQAVRLREDTLG